MYLRMILFFNLLLVNPLMLGRWQMGRRIVIIENPETGEILSETEMKRPRWEHVFYGYPDRYDSIYFDRLKQLFDKKPVKSIKITSRNNQPANDFFKSILGLGPVLARHNNFNEEEASAARVSIAIAMSPMMKELFDKGMEAKAIGIALGPLSGKDEKYNFITNKYYFTRDVNALKDWLTCDDIWGKPKTIEHPKNVEAIREEIKDKTGVCILSKSIGNSINNYATLWTGNDVIGGHNYIGKDTIISFWELKSVTSTKNKNNNPCISYPYCITENNGVITRNCAHSVQEPPFIKILDYTNYRSLDEAAMAAANIILCHVSKKGDIEYGVGIYKCVEEGTINFGKYFLTQTRQGTGKSDDGNGNDGEVKVDDNITTHNNKSIDGKYLFSAHVHSHPPANKNKYVIDLSPADYILSCGGIIYANDILNSFKEKEPYFYPMYLVAVSNRPNTWPNDWPTGWSLNEYYNTGCAILKKFTPPRPLEIPANDANNPARGLAIILAANSSLFKMHTNSYDWTSQWGYANNPNNDTWENLWLDILYYLKQYQKLNNAELIKADNYVWNSFTRLAQENTTYLGTYWIPIRTAIRNIFDGKDDYYIINGFKSFHVLLQETPIQKEFTDKIEWENIIPFPTDNPRRNR